MRAQDKQGIEKELVPTWEAATRLGMGSDKLEERLRKYAMDGFNWPLGHAMPPADKDGKWRYIIPRRRFEAYMSGEDLKRRDIECA